MAELIDRFGRKWPVEITAADVKRLRLRLGVNLYELVDDNFAGINRLLKRPEDVIDILFALCEGQAPLLPTGPAPAPLSDVEFGRGFQGATIGQAVDAFFAAYCDFFPDRRIAAILRQMFAKTAAMADQVMAAALTKVQTMDTATIVARATARLDEAMAPDSLARTLSASFGDSPAPSASTPTPTPSAN